MQPKLLSAYVIVFVLRGGETFHLPTVFLSFTTADARLKKIKEALTPTLVELLAIRDVQILSFEVE